MTQKMILGIELLFVLVLTILYFLRKLEPYIYVNYYVNLIIFNSQDEMLLVYDKTTKRLGLINTKVPFDKIPTEIIAEVIFNKLSLSFNFFDFDTRFHCKTIKFDRIRDDTAPAFILECRNHGKKECQLFYVLKMNSVSIDEVIRKYPYPDVYTFSEIVKMDMSTCPSDNQMEIISKVFNRIN